MKYDMIFRNGPVYTVCPRCNTAVNLLSQLNDHKSMDIRFDEANIGPLDHVLRFRFACDCPECGKNIFFTLDTCPVSMSMEVPCVEDESVPKGSHLRFAPVWDEMIFTSEDVL